MQVAFIVIGTLLVLFLGLRFLAIAKLKKMPLVADHEKILTLTDKNLLNLLKNRTVLVDFWAEWCAPCRMVAPVLNELAGELPSKSFIGKVNIQQYQSVAQQFKVRNIPTLILFKNGKEINRFVGVKSKDFLLKEIAKVN